MSLQTHNAGGAGKMREGWPRDNAKQSTHKNRGEAHAWMEQDKANRVVEGVQIGWELVDKSKPFVFGRSNLPWGGNGTSSLNYHPEANQPGGCLWDSGFDKD